MHEKRLVTGLPQPGPSFHVFRNVNALYRPVPCRQLEKSQLPHTDPRDVLHYAHRVVYKAGR